MNKKILIFTSSFLGIALLILNGVLCPNPEIQSYCFFDDYANEILQPLLTLCIALFSSSIFTFLISDNIFKRWIKFAIAWMIMAVIAIAVSPVYSPYIFGGPTKESVSIWMGTLFVIISLTMFAVMTWRERRHI